MYPELVIRDHSGQIQGVRYEELAPMLLSEMQRERNETSAKIDEASAKIDAQAREIRALKGQLAELSGLRQDLHAALVALQAKDAVVASASASN